MTIQAMERLTVRMVTSDKFRTGMLATDPNAKSETLQTFPHFAELDGEEVTAILAIQAKTPGEFYAAMGLLMEKRERGETLLPPLSA